MEKNEEISKSGVPPPARRTSPAVSHSYGVYRPRFTPVSLTGLQLHTQVCAALSPAVKRRKGAAPLRWLVSTQLNVSFWAPNFSQCIRGHRRASQGGQPGLSSWKRRDSNAVVLRGWMLVLTIGVACSRSASRRNCTESLPVCIGPSVRSTRISNAALS